MIPLTALQTATQAFSRGDYTVRVEATMGSRNDEIAHLAQTFDSMAEKIGEQIVAQRRLIADLSHELRTPLTRLDIALESVIDNHQEHDKNLQRLQRESQLIRSLVDDTLTLAWLENEKPDLQHEDIQLIDLLDVYVEDAKFEFSDRQLICHVPESAIIKKSNHQALGQAIENVLRNAMRFTPAGKSVVIELEEKKRHYQLTITDQGPGVKAEWLETIFTPFFRVDQSRQVSGESFGLGLALARRQLDAIGASIAATNAQPNGLIVTIMLPKNPAIQDEKLMSFETIHDLSR